MAIYWQFIGNSPLQIFQILPHKTSKALLVNFYITPSLPVKRSLTALPDVGE